MNILKKLYKYNRFKFLKESYSDFNQFSQMGIEPHSLGPGYGFAVDPSLSIYGNQDSPYVDIYSRTPMMVNQLQGIMKNLNKNTLGAYGGIKYDMFLEDVDSYQQLRILRININANQLINVYISFKFENEEYFGLYKNFNGIDRAKLHSDLFTDTNYSYIDEVYKLKLDNYFYQMISNWFKPNLDKYILLKEEGLYVKDKMGDKFLLKKDSIIDVINSNKDKNGNLYILFDYKGEKYVINKNNYYYFNYWFDEYNEK